MKGSGFCLVCLESIVPHEPMSRDGERHAYCDKPADKVEDAKRVQDVRRWGGVFARFRQD